MLSHRWSWLRPLVLAAISCICVASNTSDAPAPFRTGTSEVRVAFFATDENNQPVQKISRDDFAVVDGEAVIREFSSLTLSSETVLNVLVLVDASESVAPRFRETMKNVLQLAASSASSDRMSIVTFGGTKPVVACTSDCRDLTTRERLLSIKAVGDTPLFDALAFGAQRLNDGRSDGARDILVLFSDGDDTASTTSTGEALNILIASGIVLYTVNEESANNTKGSRMLERLAKATGGRAFSLQDGAVNVLNAISADQRASYVVTYQLPNQSVGFHPLRILPKHNLNLQFHCRRGYYYEAVQ